ncbi:ubiquinone anaerobic biosynthesis accessory factor UbiT [Thiothrix winogradskyi]|uniref:Ubiquinone biosynthesis accessory factor UbiT n=1 Tax=Thiothrix winogradskyi TaxID=96472 RepID=A0ABY3SXG6_9GAMM|nr:SCP2 sterol-binding domain-containing protein [Thiothrix winogradskyi]UJS24212.1 SCP2 sterol-binding domain-containing protein [Thiothrix winogradskyi]
MTLTPPAILAKLLTRLPAYPASLAFVSAFNLTVWKSLQELEWDALHGRRFCVHIRDLGIRLGFAVGRSGLQAHAAEEADVTFTATLMDFIRLAMRLEDPDTLFFNRRLLIEGDTDLGLRTKNMLDGVEFDTLLASFPGVVGKMINRVRERALQQAETFTPAH